MCPVNGSRELKRGETGTDRNGVSGEVVGRICVVCVRGVRV